jgi:hypothetical protein
MTPKLLHRLIGAIVVAISTFQFLSTVQPTVPFWDPGELSSAAYMLQVPHPPGGPLFSLVGRLFYILPIPGDLGLKVNLVSSFASIATVLFLYLIAVKLVESYKGGRPASVEDGTWTYIAAAIGALALSFSDTFWFNGVESNYFAASTLLYSIMVWLTLRWNERADEPGSDRYLVMIAYLAGLSAGVHLMSVPTLFAAGMVVVYKRFITDDEACKRSGYLFLVHVALILMVAFVMWNGLTDKTPPAPEDAHAYDLKFVAILATVSLVFIGIFWKKLVNPNSIYIALIVGAIATGIAYPGVIKKLPQLVHTLSGDDSTKGGLILVGVIAVLGGIAVWAAREKKSLIHLSAIGILFVVLGFTTYTMILIRANQGTPMNENEPKTLSSLLTYLNREQYGDFPQFKRRWSNEPDRQKTFTQYTSDFDFFVKYQMNHMFVRYVMFNFAGRLSRDQDADWSAKQLWGIPFLVGLFGMYYQFRRDWRMGSVFALLFVIMGFLIAFYQNQQEPQPREREYFYGGAYFVFAAWIAIGVRGLIDLVGQFIKQPGAARIATAGVLVVLAGLIPFHMAVANWHTHDRTNNWSAWENSYNMLQTCEKDGILITNGDNDTFPLWFLQDVEGIRRDVRVVNLSLGNTNWYVQQMKNKPYYGEIPEPPMNLSAAEAQHQSGKEQPQRGVALPVPISMSDARIAALQPILWEPRTMEVPVPKDVYAKYGITDSAEINKGKISWTMSQTIEFGSTKAIRVQDLLVLDIVRTNQWKRPIYFAITCSPDSRIGLDDYLRLSGLAYRLWPAKSSARDMGVAVKELEANLMNEPQGYSKTPAFGFKMKTSADTSVFFDDNESRMLFGVRSAFRALIYYYVEAAKDPVKAAAVLDRMDHVVPPSRLSGTLEETIDMAQVYQRVGNTEKFNAMADKITVQFKSMLAENAQINPYLYGAMLNLYTQRQNYADELELLHRLEALYPGDPTLKARADSAQARLARQGK